MALFWHFLSKKGDKMLLVRSEDDYKNKSYIESALHFSFISNTLSILICFVIVELKKGDAHGER